MTVKFWLPGIHQELLPACNSEHCSSSHFLQLCLQLIEWKQLCMGLEMCWEVFWKCISWAHFTVFFSKVSALVLFVVCQGGMSHWLRPWWGAMSHGTVKLLKIMNFYILLEISFFFTSWSSPLRCLNSAVLTACPPPSCSTHIELLYLWCYTREKRKLNKN